MFLAARQREPVTTTSPKPQKMATLKLLVGLGNPGREYEATRHNAGFWFIDRICDETKTTLRLERKFHAQLGRVSDSALELWLLKPTTFMNRSGIAVASLANFYKIAPQEILIAYDELDLPPGTARLKHGGGHGGHNGVKDIAAHMNTLDFWRLRLGIGHPGDKHLVVDYVLHPPSREDAAAIGAALDQSMQVWPAISRGDFSAAMLKLHSKPRPPKNSEPTDQGTPN